VAVTCQWRGAFDDAELTRLHREAFGTEGSGDEQRRWGELLHAHSLGWVVARDGDALVGFVNVAWDGDAHAFILDTMVSRTHRHRGIGTEVLALAREHARLAGCQWLHVDYEADLTHFYEDACGFAPTSAGLIALSEPPWNT
jgi:ribosomal protein S18 acetylase RimI-like enzyme